MTSTIRPTDIPTSDDIPDALPGLPEWQARKLRELWDDIPLEYRERLIALSHQLPASQEELLTTAREARRQGQIVRNQGSIRLLESWLADDDPASLTEQRATWEQLEKHLAENRVSIGDWSE